MARILRPCGPVRTHRARMLAAMKVVRLLFSQGFGTRRECARLCRDGRVRIGGRVVERDDDEVDDATSIFEVDGVEWPVRTPALLMLHKPAGHECSRDPREHPSVLSLLPLQLRQRGVQPVGRLDVDATGLLMLTDDGALLHRLTSPRHKVAKVYEVTTKHPLTEPQLQALRTGVRLHGETADVHAEAAEPTGDRSLRLTLSQGKYHQVKRMVAAAGNRVEGLHRSAFGSWVLPDDLAPGAWRWVDIPAAS